MALEQVVSSLLVKYLGDYVEGLQSENLRISLIGGKVSLRNLQLKTRILDELNLPVTVKSGFLGSLSLDIPWSNLQGRPTLVQIDHVFLIAAPKAATEMTEDQYQRREQLTKQRQLQLAALLGQDNPTLAQNEGAKATPTTATAPGEESFAEKLATRLINNLQVTVNKIHIRYEDSISNPARPFAFGITLESIVVHSTDAQWRPTLLQTAQDRIHKVAALKGFAVYWNTNTALYEFKSLEDMDRYLDAGIAIEEKPLPDHTYIIAPTTVQAKLVFNKAKVPSPGVAKIVAHCTCDHLNVQMEEFQYRDIINMKHVISNYHLAMKNIRYRPKGSSPKEQPRLWWAYAIKTITRDVSSQSIHYSWPYIKQFLADKRQYLDIYVKFLRGLETGKPVVTPLEEEILARLEQRYEFVHLLTFRRLAHSLLAAQKEKQKQVQEAKKQAAAQDVGSFFTRMWSQMNDNQPQAEDKLELTPQVWKQLHAMVDDECYKAKGAAAHGTTFTQALVSFQISSATFFLASQQAELSSTISFSNLRINAETLSTLGEADRDQTELNVEMDYMNVALDRRDGRMAIWHLGEHSGTPDNLDPMGAVRATINIKHIGELEMAFQIGCMSLDYLPKPTSDFHPHILTVSGRRQVVISVNKRFGSLADSIQQEREKKHMQLVAAGASIPPEQRYAPPEFDGRVMVFVSSVRVVYLQQFVDDLMEYIHMIKTLVHLASTESVAKFSAMGAPIERLEIDVTIQKPVCVFPRAWNSMECFEIELEAVRVSNQFRDIRLHSPNRTGPLPDSPLIERTMVEFDNMNLCTTTIVPSAKSGAVAAAPPTATPEAASEEARAAPPPEKLFIFRGPSMSLVVDKAELDFDFILPESSVSMVMQRLEIDLDAAQMKLLSDILKYNVCHSAVNGASDSYKRNTEVGADAVFVPAKPWTKDHVFTAFDMLLSYVSIKWHKRAKQPAVAAAALGKIERRLLVGMELRNFRMQLDSMASPCMNGVFSLDSVDLVDLRHMNATAEVATTAAAEATPTNDQSAAAPVSTPPENERSFFPLQVTSRFHDGQQRAALPGHEVGKVFTMDYQMLFDQSQKMKITFDNMCINLVADVWFPALTDALPVLSQDLTQAAILVTNKKLELLRYGETGGAQVKYSDRKEALISITNSDIRVIANCLDRDSLALVIASQIEVDYTSDLVEGQLEESVAVLVRDFSLARTYMTNVLVSDLHTVLLEPTFIKVLCSLSKTETAVSIGLDHVIHVTISYQDIKALIAIVQSWMVPVNLYLATTMVEVAQAQAPAAITATATATADAPMDTGAISAESALAVVPSTSSLQDVTDSTFASLTPAAPPSERISVAGKEIWISFVNDVVANNRSRPLVLVSLEQLLVVVKNWSSSLVAAFSTSLFVDFFNSSLEMWEPLCEPWSFNTSVQLQDQTWMISSENKETLNINVSAPFVETMLAITDSIKLDMTTTNKTRQPYTPYYIANHLGVPIQVTILADQVGGGGSSSSSGVIQVTPDYTQHPLPIQVLDIRKTIDRSMCGGVSPWRSRSEVARNFIVIEIPHAGALQKVDVSTVGTYTLSPSVGGEPVIVAVTLESGSKVVSVRSRISVRNHTNQTLRLMLADEARNNGKELLMPPKGSQAVPLMFAREGILSVGPQSGHYRESSTRISLARLLRANGVLAPLPMMCPNLVGGHWPFHLNAMASSSGSEIVISIYAPLVLENLLLADVEFQLGELNAGATAGASRIRKRDMLVSVISGHAPVPVATAPTGDTRLGVIVHEGRMKVGDIVEVFDFGTLAAPGQTTGQLAPPPQLALSVRLPGFDRWSAPALITGTLPAVELTAEDQRGRLALRLEREIIGNYCSAIVSMYCDFWLINRTGLRLLYSTAPNGGQLIAGQPSAGVECPYDGTFRPEYEHDSKLILFSDPLGRKNILERQTRLSVKIANSTWSSMVNISSASSGTLAIPSHSGGVGAFQLGVSIKDALHKFWRTKIVTLVPQYLLVNETDHALHYMQPGCKRSFIGPRQHTPFHWDNASGMRAIMVRLEPQHYDWSCPLSLGEIYSAVARLPRNIVTGTAVPEGTPETFYFRVTVKEDSTSGSWLVVIANAEAAHAPYRVQNQTDLELRICQKANVAGGSTAAAAANRATLVETIGPQSVLHYTWESLIAEQKIACISLPDGTPLCETVFSQISERFRRTIKGTTFMIVIDAEGPIKVLTIKIEHESSNAAKPPPCEPFDEWELLESEAVPNAEDTSPVSKLRVHVSWYLHSIGVSLLTNQSRELLYAHVAGTGLDLQLVYGMLHVGFEINRLQVDTQVLECRFPHLIYPRNLTPEGQWIPTLQLTLLLRPNQHGVVHIDTMNLRLAEMDIAFDELLLNHLIEYGKGFVEFIERNTDSTVAAAAASDSSSPNRTLRLCGADLGAYDECTNTIAFIDNKTKLSLWMLYIYSFSLDEIRINLTFKSGPGAGETSRLLQMGLIIANIDEASLVLKRLSLPLGVFESPDQVLDRVAKHYTQAALREWYKLLGAAEFLGAPGSLISHLGVGVRDFFAKPVQGLSQGPSDFGRGIVQGSSSLFKHSVHAFANTTSKVTDSIGTGMAVLTFDQEYQRNRAAAAAPTHLGEGLMQGAAAFGRGVFSGVTGVVTQPITGASEGGFGMLKGMMKGISGLVVKPAVGAVDLISLTGEGLKNTATYSDRANRHRVRLPRYIGPDCVLRTYDSHQALGQYLLWSANGGAHRGEYYVSHVPVVDGHVVFGNVSMVYVLADGHSTRWDLPVRLVRKIRKEPSHLLLILCEPVRDSALSTASDSRIIQPRQPSDYENVYSTVYRTLKALTAKTPR